MCENVCKKRNFIVHSKKSLIRRFLGTKYNLIGEIGCLFRRGESYPVVILETNITENCYPVGTHIPFIDRKIGYVLTDYESVVILYASRLPRFLRKKETTT